MAAAHDAATGNSAPRRRDRRHLRHEATRREILEAAWRMVRDDGLGSLSMSALARAVGMEPQSLYTYFDSKHALYDAMFAEGNHQLLERLAEMNVSHDPRAMLREMARTWIRFALDDPARYQLLFSRTIPGFEPSPESYALATQAMQTSRNRLADAGLTDDANFDLYTAIVSGLAAQQLANDPGGDRWLRLVDDAMDAYAGHFLQPAERAGGRTGRNKTGRNQPPR